MSPCCDVSITKFVEQCINQSQLTTKHIHIESMIFIIKKNLFATSYKQGLLLPNVKQQLQVNNNDIKNNNKVLYKN